jgi:glycosyltransferase involved in cell wall biosynthesis
MRHKLTVLIPCKNERRNIRPCIDSLRRLADEILVADSGSSDGTLDIVREMGGCRIVEREYLDSGNFKNWAIPQAEHSWVLIVDADERVTDPLAAEVSRVLADPRCDGYRIGRRNFFLGHEIKHCGWDHDAVLRLFRRDLGRYSDGGDHAEVGIPSGNVGRVKAKFLHYTYWSLEDYLRKFDRYTTLAAVAWRKQGWPDRFASLLLRAPLRFLYLYVIRLGFLDGAAGLVLCMLTAFYSFTKVAKLWALNHGLPQPDPEAERKAAGEGRRLDEPSPGSHSAAA